MSRLDVAALLVAAAARLLPKGRSEWGAAMGAELESIEGGAARLGFAAGCLLAGFKEGVAPAGILVWCGRAAVGAVTFAYALFHLSWGLNAIRALSQTAPSYDLLLRSATVGARGVLLNPLYLAPYLLAIGITHFAAAAWLMWWRPRRFAACLALALASVFAFWQGARALGWAGGPPAQVVPIFLLGCAGLVLHLMAAPAPRRG